MVCPSCGHDNREDAKFCQECGVSLADDARAKEQRKTVTVLFCDLIGSTELGETLDPERLRTVLARYFERMRAIVERHGGTVEKFIGDAVMAVFGVPVVHEDDALRAVRAAAEMRDALPQLGLQGRIGIMTGEVVTGTRERLATGDAVNVASRLESAAPAGEVLLGEPTLALVRDSVDVEPIEPLDLKGKANPVPAHRLLRVHDPPERQSRTSFVGRERELTLLRASWERVAAEGRCELVTVVGEAGVGKSRLIAEALRSIPATIARGRCLPYGEGITYSPVVEVLRLLDVMPADEAAASSIRLLLGGSRAATSAEEIAWAFRKTLERAAGSRPLVVVFDDIQWGEETFLDLVEHVALLSSGAPVLLLCVARPELRERRPAWPVTLPLGPLHDAAVDELIPQRIPGDLRDRIALAAGGNPLFVEEMVAMAAEAKGDVAVPPTLRALLAARLDQLEAAERSVLERGAIEGEVFHRGAVQALAPDEAQVTPRLAALVRKEMIRPEAPRLPGEDGFRFRHLLIRDAAYEGLPKAERADLHERFAAWLGQRGAELIELDELLGYHLEQAWRYRVELGLPGHGELAAGARRHLTAAGQRAELRADYGAAVRLLERAVSLVPPGEIDLVPEADLPEVLYWAGRGPEGLRRAEQLVERAVAAGDRVGELCGRVQAGHLRTFVEPEGATDDLAAILEEALPVFQDSEDDVALYTGYHALGWVAFMQSREDQALEAYERAAVHARRAGLPHERLGWRALFRYYGSTPVTELLTWLDENMPMTGRDHWCQAVRAGGLAMVGRFDEARAILSEARRELADRGGGPQLGTITGIESADVELLAGDPAAAVELGLEGCRLLDELGEPGFLSTAAGVLARSLCAVDRLDEAETWAARAKELGTSDDAATQMLWRQARAKVVARRGDFAEAERLGREAVAIAGATDGINMQANALCDLAEVLLLAGKQVEADAAFELALELYTRKGNLAAAARANLLRAAT